MVLKGSQIVGLVAFVAAAAGSFMPWITAGLLSRDGSDGDGIIVIIAAAAGAALLLSSRSPATSFMAGMCGLVILGVGVLDYIEVQDRISTIQAANESQSLIRIEARVGIGLYVVLVAGAVALFACVEHRGSFKAMPRNDGTSICPGCGAPLDRFDKFCMSCGAPRSQRRYSRVR